MSLLTKIFGDANERLINNLKIRVTEINQLEEKIKLFSYDEMRSRTQFFKQELKDKDYETQQKLLEQILPEAFALVREAAKRVLKQRHYDVQLMAGLVFHQGKISEMRTGEGKTLSATSALYLNALTGRGAHLITVNDYLARRDAVWMGQIYDYLGLSIGCLNHEQSFIFDKAYKEQEVTNENKEIESYKIRQEFLRPVSRQAAYQADITYGTNNEFGFDYLRDNMVQSNLNKVQRELYFAIVDEVDSILIDEARTPLIISAPDSEPTEKYRQFARLILQLKENDDFNIDEKMKAATLTEGGIKKMEKLLGVENIYTERGIKDVHHIEQALRAQTLFKKDRDYVVKEGEVIIVDEFTGRLMFGRRYSEGLHQAIEAKEGVKVQQESVTMATITFQNLFRMYKKLAGMTGTAATEAEEFSKIYNLDVIVIPTNKPMVRVDKSDVIYKSKHAKYQAIIKEIKERHQLGQPILVGTISIENNEELSNYLLREGIDHQVLNAKQHEKEAEIIAQAGKKGAVTLATNMAGRGVDIILGGNPQDQNEYQEILKLGGLHVIGTERHESRRIDNQLRGRAGRQGDSGSSQFFVSTEDDLMRIFGGERLKNIMDRLGLPEDMPIEHKLISRTIESAQRKVEGYNFDIRKHLVEYDDVINKHREMIYKKRNEIMADFSKVGGVIGEQKEESSNKQKILDYVAEEIEQVVMFHTASDNENTWNIDEIYEVMDTIFPVPLDVRLKLSDIQETAGDASDDAKARTKIINYLIDLSIKQYNTLEERINNNQLLKEQLKEVLPMRLIEKNILLQAIDLLWAEHIDVLDHLRHGIGLRGYGQRDPLVEYKREAYQMFVELMNNIRKQVVYAIYKIGLVSEQGQMTNFNPTNYQRLVEKGAAKTSADQGGRQFGGVKSESPKLSTAKITKLGATAAEVVTTAVNTASEQTEAKVGRNDPCPCGSGLKYKKCHGK